MNVEPIKARQYNGATKLNTYLKRKRRCSSAKIRHASGLSALSHMQDLRFFGLEPRSYVCPECEYIHITTRVCKTKKKDLKHAQRMPFNHFAR